MSARRDERRRQDECGPASVPEPTHAPVAAPQDGYPSSEGTCDGEGSPSIEQNARAVAIERGDKRDEEVDDGIPEFLRRK